MSATDVGSGTGANLNVPVESEEDVADPGEDSLPLYVYPLVLIVV
jgi:hypothetical protein